MFQIKSPDSLGLPSASCKRCVVAAACVFAIKFFGSASVAVAQENPAVHTWRMEAKDGVVQDEGSAGWHLRGAEQAHLFAPATNGQEGLCYDATRITSFEPLPRVLVGSGERSEALEAKGFSILLSLKVAPKAFE